MKPIHLLLFIAIITSSTSCIKSLTDDDDENCAAIHHVTITANGPVTMGNDIMVSAVEVPGSAYYSWSGPNNFQDYSPSFTMESKLSNEGWYYLSVSNSACPTKYDSVYIDVKLKQGTAPCTISNNTADYSTLSDDLFTQVRRKIDPSLNLFKLEASGGASSGDLEIFFHPYWRNREPEDGIYKTTNTPTLSTSDGNYNKVFISTVKSSIYWSSNDDYDVYVSHIGNKLQVRLCNVRLGGYNGTSYNTNISSSVTENR
jgi:hypothetical protein